MPGNGWRRRLVKGLWQRQGGLCFWCGERTKLHDEAGYFRSTGAISGKAATLDHLYSKQHPLYRVSVDHERYVMACSTCNNKRNKDEWRQIKMTGLVQP